MDRRDTKPDENVLPGPHYGTIAKSAADLADLLPVIIPDFDPTLQWGPCKWQSRDDVSLPVRGDECLIVFNNRREPVIVMWWPFG